MNSSTGPGVPLNHAAVLLPKRPRLTRRRRAVSQSTRHRDENPLNFGLWD